MVNFEQEQTPIYVFSLHSFEIVAGGMDWRLVIKVLDSISRVVLTVPFTNQQSTIVQAQQRRRGLHK
jgi:hypothetical protein